MHFSELGVILYWAWDAIKTGELVGSLCAVSGSGKGIVGLFWKLVQGSPCFRPCVPLGVMHFEGFGGFSGSGGV